MQNAFNMLFPELNQSKHVKFQREYIYNVYLDIFSVRRLICICLDSETAIVAIYCREAIEKPPTFHVNVIHSL